MNHGGSDSVADREFWRTRRVLLTGHTGFKGAWLAAWLRHMGAEVTGFSLPAPAYESPAWRALWPMLAEGGFTDLRGDVCDQAALHAAVRQADASVVLHLAAQAIVLDSYALPEQTWNTNVMGTLNVLQAMARHGHPAVIIGVTSDKCYENREWAWGYRENDVLGGHDPYSASKAAMEILLASWRSSFGSKTGIRVASARAGNVIGGGDGAAHRILPDLMNAFSSGKPALVRRPDSVRPFQHVLEPLSGYLRLARILHEQDDSYAQAYNFGPPAGDACTTRWLAEAAAVQWGDGATVQYPPAGQQPHEAGTLMLDSAKARQELDWSPRWTAREAVLATIDWHRVWLKGQSAETTAETLRQIDHYTHGRSYVSAR